MSSTPRELPASLTRMPTWPASTRALHEENSTIAPMISATAMTRRFANAETPEGGGLYTGDAMARDVARGRSRVGAGGERAPAAPRISLADLPPAFGYR